MIALLGAVLVLVIAVAAMAALADSGLRWWSAIGQARREVAGTLAVQQTMPSLRPVVTVGGTVPGRGRIIRQALHRAA